MEGLEGLAGRVEVGISTQGLADAVTVELLPHRAEDAAEDQVHMMLVNVLDDLDQDRGRGLSTSPMAAQSMTIQRSGLPWPASAATSPASLLALA